MAEGFNPSDSGAVAPNSSVVPVNPRCVKPWYVPNSDPGNPTAPNNFVNLPTGAIAHPGIFSVNTGVIGESFTLFADCGTATTNCDLTNVDNPPAAANAANKTTYIGGAPPSTPNLEYLPGAVAPGRAKAGKRGDAEHVFRPGRHIHRFLAIAHCRTRPPDDDGVIVVAECQQAPLVNAPGYACPPRSAIARMACSLTNNATVPPDGLDTLTTTDFPFTMTAGDANRQVPSGKQISSSKSVVTFPIYDSSSGATFTGNQTQVVIVGFLQVFVNSIDAVGRLNVTVLNVSGCGNAATNPAVNGTSPVPVRLITPSGS